MNTVSSGMITKLFKKIWESLKKEFKNAGYDVVNIKETQGTVVLSITAGDGKYTMEAECTPVGKAEGADNADSQSEQVGESLLEKDTLYDVKFISPGKSAIFAKNIPASEIVQECRKAAIKWFGIDDVVTVAGNRQIHAALMRTVDANNQSTVNLVAVKANYDPSEVLSDLSEFTYDSNVLDVLPADEVVSLAIDVTDDGYEYNTCEDADALAEPASWSIRELMRPIYNAYTDALYISYYMVGSGAPADAKNACEDMRWMAQSQFDKLCEICIELGVDVPHPAELISTSCNLCTMSTEERMRAIYDRAVSVISAIDLYYCNFTKDIQGMLNDWLRGWNNLVYYRMRNVANI